MKTLPNGLTVFNATPHAITFWREDWNEPVSVDPDELVNATVSEENANDSEVAMYLALSRDVHIDTVRTVFHPSKEGHEVIARALDEGAHVVIGSIIAAQAYPGKVLAMVPAPGYERVPPAEKRMLPDKFTIFPPAPDKEKLSKVLDEAERNAYLGATAQWEYNEVIKEIGEVRADFA